MPEAPAAFKAGMISRTTDSSTMVSTSNHPAVESPEMAGFFIAG